MFNRVFDLEKTTDRFDGFYRGVVEDVIDPTESGRIRIKVYPMFESVDTNVLPWAIPADSTFGGSANIGNIAVPIVGSHVFCFFENGDFRYPVYFASAPAIENGSPDVPTLSRKDDGTVASINTARSTGVSTAFGGTWDEPVSAYATTYPKNKVFRSEKGIIIEIDDTTDNVRLHVYHPSGTRMEVDDIGNMVEHIKAKKTTVIIGDENIEVKGDQNTTVGGNHGVKVGSNGKVVITGNYDITVGSACTITVTGNTTLTTPLATINGNVQVNGTIDSTGNISSDSAVSAGGNVSSGAVISDSTGSMQDMRDSYNSHTAHPPNDMT